MSEIKSFGLGYAAYATIVGSDFASASKAATNWSNGFGIDGKDIHKLDSVHIDASRFLVSGAQPTGSNAPASPVDPGTMAVLQAVLDDKARERALNPDS